MKVIVTGGAGYLGSHLVDKLLSFGENILVIDNFSTGREENIAHNIGRRNFNYFRADLRYPEDWHPFFRDVGVVMHFAADPSVKDSFYKPDKHFRDEVIATYNVVENVRKYDVEYLVFASSSTVYGEASTIPTPEDYRYLEPISIYGGFKLACENILKCYAKLYGIKLLILRYANVVGGRGTRGVVYDFIVKLNDNPSVLEILGDGTQKKSYIYIDDAINATIHLYNLLIKNRLNYDTFNIGSEDWISVNGIASIVVKEMGLKNVIFHLNPQTPDGRGWIGDVKNMLLDVTRLKETGFKFKYPSSSQAIRRAVKDYLKILSISK